ncbi:hypothetical protein [Phenylobacterium immobile]|uniref:hypothetical protein n=1 Tax=Phenylobacterium immobile TaxID=21 RepID=UPI000ACD532E|nr:hypothetical protein [Phenylobacterium immobile]
MTARLLTDRALAEYLSLPLTSARKVAAGRVMLGGRVRWDRIALDAWLDEMQGVTAQLPANENPTPADEALARFLEGQRHAPRRP